MNEMMPILNTAGILLNRDDRRLNKKTSKVNSNYEVWQMSYDEEGEEKESKKIAENLTKQQSMDLMTKKNKEFPDDSIEVFLNGKRIASLMGYFDN